jgi:hypothetical protein
MNEEQRLKTEAAIKNGEKDLSRADMSGMQLFDADLERAELVGSDLTGCDFTHCNMKGADLTRARLVDSRLWNSDLTDSNLTEAQMKGADLWNARLFNSKMWRADLTGARSLSIRNFSKDGSASWKARIDESGPLSAEDSYRALKNYFMQNGMYNDASWASYREKTMERMIMKKNRDAHYIPSLFMSLVCGYGERPHRIVFTALFTITFFALFHYALNSIQSTVDPSYALRWSDYLYYSTITFTTVGYGDFVPKAAALFRLSAALEAFLGVFLTGLFIFTLARKYSAR